METTLLQYFSEELAYLRDGTKQFAKRYPHVASRLNLSKGQTEDPHITRLLEAFALISSRIRLHQDHHFVQLNTALLETLFPHYLAPQPSMAIVQFTPSDSLTASENISRGQLLETLSSYGTPLHFTTSYATEVLPLSIADVKVHTDYNRLDITLNCLNDKQKIVDLGLTKLRFFMHTDHQQGFNLCEQLMTNCAMLTLHHSPEEKAFATLSADAIKPVGLQADEAILPWSHAAAPAARLLSEYLTFKDKFLFFDIDFSANNLAMAGHRMTLQLQFTKRLSAALNYLTADNLLLNCTPVINLFKKTLEPLMIDGQQYEYPLTVDKRHADHYEIHTIEQVSDITDTQHPQIIPGLYRPNHYTLQSNTWSAQRKYHTIHSHQTSSMYLSLSERTTMNNNKRVLAIEASCFNGDLPKQLNLPQHYYHLQLANGGASLAGIRFISQPTPVYHRSKQQTVNGQLINQLADNVRLMTDAKAALQYIKNTLISCNITQTKENNTLIDSIIKVEPQQIIMRTGNNKLTPYYYGTEMQITLKAERLSGHSVFLFKQILQSSFSLESNLNSRVKWKFILE